MSGYYDPQFRPEPPKRSPWPIIIAVVVGCTLLLAACGGVAVVVMRMQARMRARFNPPRAPVAPLRPADTVVDEWAERPQIVAMFDALVARQGGPAMHFDIRRMLDEMASSGAPLSRVEQEAMQESLLNSLGTRMDMVAFLESGSSHEIRQLSFLQSKGEVQVLVRHRTPGDTPIMMRWWLRKSGGRWRIYDYQDMATNIRVSTFMAVLMSSLKREGFSTAKAAAMKHVIEGAQAAQNEDVETAERELRSADPALLPAELQCVRCMLLAAIHNDRGECQEALDLLDQAEAARADAPALDYVRAVTCNELGRHEEAATCARAYLKAVGDDADAFLELGIALAGLGRPSEAAEAFRAGLKDYPESGENLEQLARVLPEDQADELCQHLARFGRPQDWFEFVAEALIEVEHYDALEALIETYRANVPQDPDNDYYLGAVLYGREDYSEAAAAFMRGLPRAPDEDREFFVEYYVESMVLADKPLEAYDQLTTRGRLKKSEAFKTVADWLLDDDTPGRLEELIERHRQQVPGDVWLAYYDGHVKLEREQFEAAAGLLRAALRRVEGEDRAHFNSLYFDAASRAGQALEAYREASDAREAFRALAQSVRYRDLEQLEQLVESHRVNHADDPWLANYQGELELEREHFDAAAAQFKFAWKNADDEDTQQRFVDSYLHAMRRAGKALAAYRAAPDSQQAFQTLAEWLSYDDDDTLRKLIAAHRAEHPRDPWPSHYEAGLAENDEQYEQAATHYRDAWQKAAADDRWQFMSGFLNAMRMAGKVVEGYRAAPDPQQAFTYLAPILAGDPERLTDLRALIAAHGASHADDVWVLLYTARAHALAGEYAEADIVFARARDKAAAAYPRNQIDYYRLRARYDSGNALAGYREIGPPADTFRRLAEFCLDDANVKTLAELVAAHQAAVPDDPQLPKWEIEVRWLEQDYARVIELLRQGEQRFVEDDWWWFDLKLVRAHLRLKQFDEALRAAQVSQKRDDDPFIVAIVHAVAGNAAEFQRAAEACFETEYYDAFEFYQDEDAGPALKAPAFAEFRKKYPPEEE